MKYTYFTKVEITRINDKEINLGNADDCTEETILNEFTETDPFLARNNAFNNAKSFVDNFESAEKEKTDNFFSIENGWYNKYVIYVIFVNPETKEEIIIYDTENESLHALNIRIIIRALEQEYNILKNNQIPTTNSLSVSIRFLPSNEVLQAIVFPTEWINKKEITIQEITLDEI